MDILRRFFAWFWSKILRRTGYKALINGMIINGCGLGCDFNKEMKLLPYAPMAHYCTAMFDPAGNPKVIYDPYDVPAFCPFRVSISEGK